MTYNGRSKIFEEYEELVYSVPEGHYLIADLFPDENQARIKRRFERVSAAMGIQVKFHEGRYDNLVMSFTHPQVIDVSAELQKFEEARAVKASQPKKQRMTAQKQFRTQLKRKAVA